MGTNGKIIFLKKNREPDKIKKKKLENLTYLSTIVGF